MAHAAPFEPSCHPDLIVGFSATSLNLPLWRKTCFLGHGEGERHGCKHALYRSENLANPRCDQDRSRFAHSGRHRLGGGNRDSAASRDGSRRDAESLFATNAAPLRWIGTDRYFPCLVVRIAADLGEL